MNLIMVTRFRINVYVCNFKINHLKISFMIDKKNKNKNKKIQLTFLQDEQYDLLLDNK